MNFVVVRSPSSYNGIIRRTRVRKIKAVPSIAHGMIKFPVSGGIVTLQSSKLIPLECTMVSRPEGQPFASTQAMEERIKVAIHPEYPEQTIAIGSTLTEDGRKELLQRPEQGMSYGWLSARRDRLEGGIPLRIPLQPGDILLLKNAFWFEERRSNLPTSGRQSILKTNWQKLGEAAFKQMKNLIAELHTLTVPMEKEELIVYLVATREAVSAVLMIEREAKQMPIYFVSRVLQGPEINYTPVEKLVLALVHASKRLKRPRVSIKGQILVDFIVEQPEDDSLAAPMKVEEELPEPWTLFTDKSSCIDGFGAGLILTNPEGTEFTHALRFEFDVTNNEADQRVLHSQGTRHDPIPRKGKTLTNSFKKFSIKQVPRSENKKSDALSKIVSTSFAHLTKQVLVEVLKEKSINEAKVLTVVKEEGNTWMAPIYEYITEEILPAKKKKARVVQLKSRRYSVINGVLYKKSFLEPWLRCVRPLQANYILREIHEGSFSMPTRPRSMAYRTMIKSRNEDTPFSLTYGTEAVIPAEIGMPTLGTTELDMVQNDEALKLNLDLLEEKRELAAIHEARSKAK
ncbi:reverse transcriptase domain-containing protein [Tanacetum coccineum]